MRRIRELVAAATAKYPRDTFFERFEDSCRKNDAKRKAYRTYEDALRVLDNDSWDVLKGKAVSHFRDHRSGQLKQGFFNQLNEAFAYRHLVRNGFTDVQVLRETGRRTPDIRYRDRGKLKFCEVKTINISDEEITRRGSKEAFSNIYVRLSDSFLSKFTSTVSQARDQVVTAGDRGLVYVIVLWDDFALDNYDTYRKQLKATASELGFDHVHVKVGLRFNRRMRLTCHAADGGVCKDERRRG